MRILKKLLVTVLVGFLITAYLGINFILNHGKDQYLLKLKEQLVSCIPKIDEPCTLIGDLNGFTALAFSPQGELLATSDFNKRITLWDTIKTRELRTFTGHTANIYSLIFNPNGDFLASIDVDGEIILWEIVTGEIIYKFNGNNKALAFSPDGQLLVTAGDEIKFWEISTNNLLYSLDEYSSALIFISETQLLTFDPNDKKITVLRIDPDNKIVQILDYAQMENDPVSGKFSPDGKMFVGFKSKNRTPFVIAWETENGKEIGFFGRHDYQIMDFSFSFDGKFLATASQDMTIQLWEIITGTHLDTLYHSNWVESVAFSPDSKLLTAATAGNVIKLWLIQK